jgi:hypothetical protein
MNVRYARDLRELLAQFLGGHQVAGPVDPHDLDARGGIPDRAKTYLIAIIR